MKQYALIGFPLSHSFSPAMHNAAFAAKGMDARYELCEIAPDVFDSTVGRCLRNVLVDGFNVTVPYKERVMPFLDEISHEALCIGAVNTVVKEGGRLIGYNTDQWGFLRSLQEDLGFDSQGKHVVVIGAGGAGKACLYGLAKSRAEHIILIDIDQDKARQLVEAYAGDFPDVALMTANPDDMKETGFFDGVDLLVNASSCGMKPEHPELVSADVLPKGMMCVYDVIYNPAATRLLQTAKQHGLAVSNGLGMLLYQGVRAWELWVGHEAPVAVMRDALCEQMNLV